MHYFSALTVLTLKSMKEVCTPGCTIGGTVKLKASFMNLLTLSCLFSVFSRSLSFFSARYSLRSTQILHSVVTDCYRPAPFSKTLESHLYFFNLKNNEQRKNSVLRQPSLSTSKQIISNDQSECVFRC